MEQSDSRSLLVEFKNATRFLIKNTAPLFARVLLSMGGSAVNKDGYKKRVLVMFGGGIGDVAKRSIVCGYAKEYLAEYDVYYLMPYDLSLPDAATTIRFDYKKAKINPFYYLSLVNQLRRIGFANVIVLLPAWEGFLASLGSDISPDALYRYTEVPPKELAVMASLAVRRSKTAEGIYHDIDLVSFYDKRWTHDYFPSDVYRMAYFFSQAIAGIALQNTAHLNKQGLLELKKPRTEVELTNADTPSAISGDYCVMGIGSSFVGKDWAPEYFGQVAGFVAEKGLKIVLVGGAENTKLLPAFRESYKGEVIDLMGKTSLPELCRVIAGAKIVIANDTSATHLAIALQRPTVCVCFGPQIGADSCYGYKDINHWFFWYGTKKVEPGEVIKKTGEVLSYIDGALSVPKTDFALSFFDQDLQSGLG
jgi:hypothetical protein